MSGVEAGLGRATAARWRVVRRSSVAVLSVGLVAGIVVAPGFDQREVEADNPSVWALQSGTGERMARVNTVVGELDTVKGVANASEVVQADGTLLVYTNNLGSVTALPASRPVDVDEAGTDTTLPTPPGTDAVVSSGGHVAYLTESGEVYTGSIEAGTATSPAKIDPYAELEVAEGEDRPQFRAVSVAISEAGNLVAYSAEERSVLIWKPGETDLPELEPVAGGPQTEAAQVTWVGETWVVLDPEGALVWHAESEGPVAVPVDDSAVIQQASAGHDAVYVADEFGMVRVPLEEGEPERVQGRMDSFLGQPAVPTPMPGGQTMVGAWLLPGATTGVMWLSSGTSAPLEYAGQSLPERPVPVLRSNGSRMILNELRSGWVWAVPTGALLPSSQQWEGQDESVSVSDDEQTVAQVSEPRAPHALDDEFGVRAGRQVSLPVLLNDNDANRDVLTVVRNTVAGLPEDFGTLSVSDDDQTIVIDVADDATGSASFTYRISDGTTSDGLQSEDATVTVTVMPDDVNNPPVWCDFSPCDGTWPQPQVNPGGTVSIDVLTGWVDPEGDPIYLAGATTNSSVGDVAAAPEGQVVFQHGNASDTEVGAIPVEVSVSDTRGASTTKDLAITVIGEPELRVEDVATSVTAGVTATINVADRVSGARGPIRVSEATLGPNDDADITITPGEASFGFAAEEPGSYLVDYTVSDGISEGRATARVTVIDPEDEQISTGPLTAFVRAREDVTINVLSAVSNPGGRVLLVSDLETEPADGAVLSADAVGHSAIRLSGATSDERPGTLGVVSYTVSDGNADGALVARGEVTVVLLSSDTPTTPLAVDDAMTVRVGTQADISVLSNDLAPAGNVIALDASSVAVSDGGGLAFPAGTKIRYLAPDTPGEYVIDYGAYVLGYPKQSDDARVVVTVLATDTNSPPAPRPMSGRVASGQSVRLPFNGTGIDPDGDAVRLNRVEEQPAFGTAAVSADGQALVYTSDPAFAGQVSFPFSVVDARGQEATATATIGVLDSNLDPRPVTYTDYVQAQVGESRRVLLSPTANDIDLGGGELTLGAVTPDAPEGSAEYDRLAALLEEPEGELVPLRVGTEPGTHSFVYSVSNSTGSTAIGRIILKAVREPIADVPIVADTVLTNENRDTFATGVNVLSEKVVWGSGNVSELKLSLWGEPEGVSVNGWTISGPLPDTSRLVPFQVSGTNFAGEDIVSYGFLRVPGEKDEIRVALKESFTPPEVDEGSQVTFNARDFVAVPPGADVSIRSVAATGARVDSTCEVVEGWRIRYTAGEGAPYSDACQVGIEIEGQDGVTVLPIPIVVIAIEPVPALTGASLEVSPGSEGTLNLNNLVTWPDGTRDRAVTVDYSYQGDQFEVTESNGVITVAAKVVGTQVGSADSLTVSLPSDPDVQAVNVTLKVGPLPSQLPKGASVVQQCRQSEGRSCTIQVLGAAGEINPFPGEPLTLESVAGDDRCSTVSWSLAGDSAVRATWTNATAGAVCDATFVLADARDRVTQGDRIGSVSLDLQGYPAAPKQIQQTAYGDGSVTLAVTPGAASSSYPSISGFTVYDGNREVSTCTARGRCEQLTGVTNGDKRTYTAVAVNAEGESRDSVSTTAWSYAPPAQPTVTSWRPVPGFQEGGVVDLEFRVRDASTQRLVITAGGRTLQEVPVTGAGKFSALGLSIGTNDPLELTVTPVTRHELPPVGKANSQGSAASITVNGVRGPQFAVTEWAPGPQGQKATFQVTTQPTGAGSNTFIGRQVNGECVDMVRVDGASAAFTTAIESNRAQDVTLCAESRYAGSVYGSATTTIPSVFGFEDPGGPTWWRGYGINQWCANQPGNMGCATTYQSPGVYEEPGFSVWYSVNGGAKTSSFTLEHGVPVNSVLAYYCMYQGTTQYCSSPSKEIPRNENSPVAPAKVEFLSCDLAVDQPNVDLAGRDENYLVEHTWWRNGYQQADNPWERKRMSIKVTFLNGLSQINHWESGRMECGGTAPTEPEPEPDPDETEDPDPEDPDPEDPGPEDPDPADPVPTDP